MRMLISALALFMLAGQALPASAADGSCQAALESVRGEWYAAGYPMPTKPGQRYVNGRDGRQATGGQVTYMRTQLIFATRECRSSNDTSALERIASVHRLLSDQASMIAKDGDGRAAQH